MNFNRQQTLRIWERFLEWDRATDVQFNYRHVDRKNSVEVWLYLKTENGYLLRVDYEINLEDDWSSLYIYNWTDEDLDKMPDSLIKVAEKGMVEYGV